MSGEVALPEQVVVVVRHLGSSLEVVFTLTLSIAVVSWSSWRVRGQRQLEFRPALAGHSIRSAFPGLFLQSRELQSSHPQLES